jgi:choline monooxygenase
MSDLATLHALTKTSPQLPIPWYFDPQIYALEQKLLFEQGPGYVGHERMAPNRGDYQVLARFDNGKALVRAEQGVQLISNVCRHRQAIILKDRGTTKSIVCPLHRWTYGLDGKLLGAPHFPGNPCLDLGATPLANWNGLLFNGKRDVARDLARLGVKQDLDFSGFMLDRVQIDEYACNWKTFIEVYLEDYHVGPFHPGLGSFVACDDLRWEFKDNYSVQTVGVSKAFNRPGSRVYQRWHDALLKYREGQLPERGAIWLTYYPHIMVEWYPHVLTVSTLHPMGPQKTMNMVEFYYPEDIAAFEREFVESQQAAYMETCIEDDEIAERMDAGRRALIARGDNEVGPYQSPMEDGMQQFHEWYRRQLATQSL